MKINRTATTRRLGRTATAVLVGLSLTATACGGSNNSADNSDAELAELIDLVVESASERLAESATTTDINAVAVAPAPNTDGTPASSASPSSSDTSRTDDDTRVAPAATPDTSTSDTPAPASSGSDDVADTPMDDTTGDATESAPIEPAGDADEPMADEPMDDEPMDEGYDDGEDTTGEAVDEADDDTGSLPGGRDDLPTFLLNPQVTSVDQTKLAPNLRVNIYVTSNADGPRDGIASVVVYRKNSYNVDLMTEATWAGPYQTDKWTATLTCDTGMLGYKDILRIVVTDADGRVSETTEKVRPGC